MEVRKYSDHPIVYFCENPGSLCTTIKDTHIELLETASDIFVSEYISTLRYNSRASRGGKELWRSEDPRQSRDAAEGTKFIQVLLKKLEWDAAHAIAIVDDPILDVWEWLYDTWNVSKSYIELFEAFKDHIEYYEVRGKDVEPLSVTRFYSNYVGPGSWKNTPEQRCIPWHFESEDSEGAWYSTGKEKVRFPGTASMTTTTNYV